MSGSRIAEMDPRCTLEQFSLLTRLMSIGERLHQTGLPIDSMFQAIYNMEQSYCLGEKLPVSGTAPLQVFTYDQHMLLTRQLAIHQRLQETGLSDASIIYSLFTMQMKTGNMDIDDGTPPGEEGRTWSMRNCMGRNTADHTLHEMASFPGVYVPGFFCIFVGY
ncbi:Hypp3471 [Branchiostoma lanceolatum]|uniref:Hypp3471 protein n=1 Tax=Branchiostoma lanceolatum TaxID=7740 RepID=A0A8K0A323_BRALA|nr:Hypp3471 [Branchiostoma lanceolatum]